MLQKITDFIKKETVLTIATVLAVASAFWVHPGPQYVGYIDWRVLGILLSLMLIVAGFQSNGLFDAIGSRLLAKTKNTAQLMLVLVFLCFFSSMFITNDVALLTFVPFACTILQKCHQERLIVTAFVLQTLAANLGSMLTPVGNPQNLYLYSISGAGLGEFVGWMAPYTLVSGVLLLLVVFVLSAGKRRISLETEALLQTPGAAGRKKNGIYLALFVLSLLSVARVLPWELMARRGAHCAHFYGSRGVFADGLLSAVYVYQFLHLHRQYGEYRGGTVCPAKSCGGQGTGGWHRCEPDHQQCSCDTSSGGFHAGYKKSHDRRESGRTGNAHCLDGESDLL